MAHSLPGPRMGTVGLARVCLARHTFVLHPRRLGAVARARGCRPGLKIMPQAKHMYAKEKWGINSCYFPVHNSLLSTLRASDNGRLGHISKLSGQLSLAIQITFQLSSSIILSKRKIFISRGKKGFNAVLSESSQAPWASNGLIDTAFR